MIYKLGDILGEVVEHLPYGMVRVDYGGTMLTLSEQDNEYQPESQDIICETNKHKKNCDWNQNTNTCKNKCKEFGGEITTDSKAFAQQIISPLRQIEYGIGKFDSPLAKNGMKTNEETYSIGYRPEFMKGTVILGREIVIKLPNGETPKGQFAIVELNDVLASHNENNFSSTENYPLDKNGENINDRNYSADVTAQGKVLEYAQKLEPDRLITTSRTPSGTPVISVDGVVISGNNRTMSIKLALQKFPDKYKAYCDFLIEEIEAYGIKLSDKVNVGAYKTKYTFTGIDNITHTFLNPILVRIDYDVKEYNTMELAKWNKDTKKSEKPIDKAIKLGKILEGSEKCTNVISEIVSRYETFSEFYSNFADQKQLKDTLVDCNILTTQELPAFFYERGFTEGGKELVENLLAGMVLSKEGLLASNEGGARAFRQTIITSLPVLITNLSLGENSLNNEINEALLLQAKMSNNKLSFFDLLAQTNIFDEKATEWGVYINRLLALGRNKFKGAIEGYNSSTLGSNEANLFGDKPTKEEIFNAHIISKIPDTEITAIQNAYVKDMVAEIKTSETLTHPIDVYQMTQREEEEAWHTKNFPSNTPNRTKFNTDHDDFTDAENTYEFAYTNHFSSQFNLTKWDRIEKHNDYHTVILFWDKAGITMTINDNKSPSGAGIIVKTPSETVNFTDDEYYKAFDFIAQIVPIELWSVIKNREREWKIKSRPNFKSKPYTQKELDKFDQKTMYNNQPNPFIKGNYFLEHPEKILAEKGTGKNWRTQAEITTYKGDISNVAEIDADESFLSASNESNPVVSVITETVEQATDSNTEVVNNIAKALEQNTKDEGKKALRKVKKSKVGPQTSGPADSEIVSVAENFAKLSPNIPLDDVKAFLIYQKERGRPITNPDWIAMTGLDRHTLYNEETKRALIMTGHLNYFDGTYLPSYLYFAENIYDKNTRLISASASSTNSGQDKDFIIENYGQEVYDNQVRRMQEAFSKQYEKRLLIQGEGRSDGLFLLPISDFAHKFVIKTLENDLPFKWKLISAQANSRFGQMDLLAVGVSDKDKKEIPELSLTDAFGYWLRTDETIPFHKGISYADVIGIYLRNKSKPRGTAVPTTIDGKQVYIGEQLVIKKREDADWERLKSKAKGEGNRLFAIFIDTQLTTKDKIRLEAQWNRDFNGYVPIDYASVPVAFRSNRYFDGFPGDIESEKREAVAFTFSEGSGLLAYDVGVGKTPSAIFTISQYIDTGWAKRPMLVVPNQTYKQWIAEFKKFAGHIKVNEFYNLSSGYLEDFTRDGKIVPVEPGSVSIFTYEGMKHIGFNDTTIQDMEGNLSAILLQESPSDVANALKSNSKANKDAEKLKKKVEELIGNALSKTTANIEDLGFDFICFDEAHACKKVFTYVKGQAEESTAVGDQDGKGRSVNQYEITSGQPSLNGIKGFMLTHYIQTKFQGNTLLLTATPFTNSPLEIYSMLSMIAYNKLSENGIDNIKTFFDTYVNVSYEMIINSKLRPQRKQVILGFNNLIPLQTLIRRFINYKDGDMVESVRKKRPNKVVLPLRQKMIDGVLMNLNEDERKDTILPFTPLQEQIMEQIKRYADGEISDTVLCAGGHLIDEAEDGADISEGVELDEESLDKSEKAGVRTLKALAHARNLALSPYIFECSGLKAPDYMSYIETSNKLKYVMECISSIKKHHADHNQSMSGVIIYMDRGKIYFPLIKEYLVKVIGFAQHEIGIMSSGIMEPTIKGLVKEDQKEYIKNLFLGLKYNDATQEVEKISDEERVKVVIGSSMIREGINLQAHTSTLFNCWLDWNPSDQKQLYGRCFRQGNKFKTIRLVVPLMIDSIDIFMFQKLEEKTTRINSIWETDGKSNAFNTEEFDPKQLKRVLIKNPRIVAEIELLEISEKFDEDISDERNVITRLGKVAEYEATIKRYEDDLEEWLEDYRPNNQKTKRSVETNVALALEVLRKQTDSKGKPMVEDWKQTKQYKTVEHTDKEGKVSKRKQEIPADEYYSDLSPARSQYWFNDLAIAVRSLKREVKNYLEPNGIKISAIPKFIEKKEKEIQKMVKEKESLTDKKAIDNRAELIIQEREQNKYKLRELPEVVSDFVELNDLLNETKTPSVVVEKAPVSSCPPVDEKGEVRIDAEAQKMLDDCNNALPQTKRLHSTEDKQTGERIYNPERQALHDKILGTFVKDAVCIERIQPIAILTGGGPGSGKSTFLRKFAPYITSDKIIKIDADEVRSMLPEYQGWNSHQTHEETRDIVNELLNTFDKPCKHDILYDGTMSNAKKYLPLIDKLKSLGYKVFVAFMEVPKEVSVQRAMNRYKDNKDGKTKFGRYVPMEVINDFFATGLAGFEKIKKMVDGYVRVDGLTQKIVEQGGQSIPTDRDYSVMFDKATFNVGDSVEVSVGGSHGKLATIKTKIKMGSEDKYLLLFPDNTELWTNDLAIVGLAEAPTKTPSEVEPTKADMKASLKATILAIKYSDNKTEKADLNAYKKGLLVAIKYA